MAKHRTESERAAQLIKVLPHLETLLSKPAKIAIKTKGRIVFVDLMDVVIVEARGITYCCIGRPVRISCGNRSLRWQKN